MKKKDSLIRQVENLEIEAREFGFYWENLDQLIEQIQSECLEVQEAWNNNDRTHLEEEVGDLLQAAISLAIFCELDPYETLDKSIKKFQKRYNAVIKLAKSEGYDHLRHQPIGVLMDFWKRAKRSDSGNQEIVK